MVSYIHFVLDIYHTWYPGKQIKKYLVTKFVKNHVQNGCIATTYTQQFFKVFSTTCVVLPNNMTNVILSTCKSISISTVEHWTYE